MLVSNVSNVNRCSDHWNVKTEPNKTIYEYIDSDQLGTTPLIHQVTVDDSYTLDKIVFTGKRISSLYQDIKSNVDAKYTDILSGTVTLLVTDIWISCCGMNRQFPGELDGLLEKIYRIISVKMPCFSEISEKINNTVISLGNRRGISYFNHQANLLPKMQNSGVQENKRFEITEKLSSFNFLPKSDSSNTNESSVTNTVSFMSHPTYGVSRTHQNSTKSYWLSYMQGKIERYRTPSRPNPLPCTGSWGVNQNRCCLSTEILSTIKDEVSLLEQQTPRPLIEYEEGDWGDWSGYPRDKWSSKANKLRTLWGPIFLEEDKSTDDVYNGFVRSARDSDEAIGRIIGFSCNDERSPLGGIYFVKQRCTSTSIAITLFANEGLKEEFELWLTKAGLLPIVQPVKITGDEYLRHGGDKASFYKPARFFDEEQGIFGTIVMRDIEKLRMILAEHCYQIEPAYDYAFNNICNAQTGVAPYRLPS